MNESMDTSQKSENREIMGEKWQLLPNFVLRQTGFPIELLDVFASPDLSIASNAFIHVIMHLREVRHQTLALLRTYQRQELPFLVWEQSFAKMHVRLEKGVVISPEDLQWLSTIEQFHDLFVSCLDWNSIVQSVQEEKQFYCDMYNKQIEQKSLLLIRLFAQNLKMREVLLISNEANYDLFDNWLRSAELKMKDQNLSRNDKRKVDTLMMYLQRICTKNDTNSHFGPFSAGRVKKLETPIFEHREERMQRVAFYTHWAASRIAQKMSQDPALIGAIQPRRNPLLFLHTEKQEIRRVDFDYDAAFENDIERNIHFSQSLALTVEEARLLKACDGGKSVTDLFSAWQQEGVDTDWETFIQMLKSLNQREVIYLTFEIPVGSQNTLRDLRKLLPTHAQDWISIIDHCDQLIQQFSRAGNIDERRALFTTLKNTFQHIVGESPMRGMGQTYADRSILFEECFLNFDELEISGVIVETIERDLSLFYNLLLLASRYRLDAERRMLNDWFKVHFKAMDCISLEDFLAAFVADATVLEQNYAHIDAEVHLLTQKIEESIITPSVLLEKEIKVDSIKLRTLLATYTVFLPAVCNPDVMISATSREAIEKGDFEVVVGDCHAAREILSHTSLTPFLEQKFPDFIEKVTHLYQSIIGEDEEIVDIIRTHPEKTAAQAILPCFDIELYGRSPKARSEVLSLQDLMVYQTSKGLRLYAPRLQKFIRPLSTGFGAQMNRRNPFNIFGFPRHHSGLVLPGYKLTHIPRISMNRVIIQREMWRIPLQVFAQPITVGNVQMDDNDAGIFLRAKQIQETYKLPRYVFAKISSEPKVIYVDFEAPLLVRQLQRLIKHAEGDIEFSEMFPGPGQFWLTSSQGHHTCELRCAVFSMSE